jgi:hypothetical protein
MITKNLGLWNTMMGRLDDATDLNIEEMTQRSDLYSSRAISSFGQSQTTSLAQGKQNISFFNFCCIVSVKDDARDLLDRYS